MQQTIALLFVAFFIARLIWQRKKNLITGGELSFWLVFWFMAGLAIIFIKKIDGLVKTAGFSASGIDILLYLAVILLFYMVFKIRLKMELMERNITKLVRQISHNEARKKDDAG